MTEILALVSVGVKRISMESGFGLPRGVAVRLAVFQLERAPEFIKLIRDQVHALHVRVGDAFLRARCLSCATSAALKASAAAAILLTRARQSGRALSPPGPQ